GAGAGGARLHQGAARRARAVRRDGEGRERRRATCPTRGRRRARWGRLARAPLPLVAPRRPRPRCAEVAALPLVVLVILDGWGIAPPGPGNAVALADTPVFDRIWRDYPHTTLQASGEAVGLPPGQMGNSEVGHLTIGSGRILFQDLQRVNRASAPAALFEHPALVAALSRACR